jgi:hypothetical protein
MTLSLTLSLNLSLSLFLTLSQVGLKYVLSGPQIKKNISLSNIPSSHLNSQMSNILIESLGVPLLGTMISTSIPTSTPPPTPILDLTPMGTEAAVIAPAKVFGPSDQGPDPDFDLCFQSLGPAEIARINLANKAFRRYTELQYSLSHTRCSKLRLSYREDILGML